MVRFSFIGETVISHRMWDGELPITYALLRRPLISGSRPLPSIISQIDKTCTIGTAFHTFPHRSRGKQLFSPVSSSLHVFAEREVAHKTFLRFSSFQRCPF